MLRQVEGNILKADVEALVNTVNPVGIMPCHSSQMWRFYFTLRLGLPILKRW